MKTKPKLTAIQKFTSAFIGILDTIKSEMHFRIQLFAMVLVMYLGFYFRISQNDWLWLITCFAMVLGAELLNTAIEHVVDLVSPDYNRLAKKAKDAAAGAVLVICIFSSIIGTLIFWRYF